MEAGLVDDAPASALPLPALRPGGRLIAHPRAWWALVAGCVAVCLPGFAIALPVALRDPTTSNFGDVAATELAVQNALRFHQALGPYDRFGWYHPGPALFYLLALPYAAFGHSAAALSVGACLINTIAGVAIVAVLWRRAGARAALAGAAALCAFMVLFGIPNFVSAWSPVVITIPFALFVVLCADVVAGGDWSAVAAVAVGSFLVQTEVGTVPVVAVALILAVVARTIRRKGPGWRRQLPSAGAGAVLLAVIWAPPVVQQRAGHPGNMTLLWDFFSGTGGQHRLATTIKAVSDGMALGLGPAHVADLPSPVGGYVGAFWAMVLVAVLVSAACWWRRHPMGVAMGAAVVVLALLYAAALTDAVDRLSGYLVVWTGSLTLCLVLATVLAATPPPDGTGRRLVAWNDRASRAGQIGVAVLLVATCGWATTDATHQPERDRFGTVTTAATAVERLLPAHTPVLVCVSSQSSWPHAAGVVADLRAKGWDLRIQPFWLHVFGTALTPSGQERYALLVHLPVRGDPGPRHAPGVFVAGGLQLVAVHSSGPIPALLCPPVAAS